MNIRNTAMGWSGGKNTRWHDTKDHDKIDAQQMNGYKPKNGGIFVDWAKSNFGISAIIL